MPTPEPPAEPTEGAVKKPRWRRRLAVAALILLALFAVVVTAGPSIAAPFVRGPAQSAISDQIEGSVEIDAVSLAWLGGIRADGVRLFDPGGAEVARVDVALSKGVLDVLLERWWSSSSLALGEITVSGEADIVRGKDGALNIERAVAPVSRATPSSGSSERAFAGDLVFAGLTVRARDISARYGAAAAAGAALDGLTGSIEFGYDGSTAKADGELATSGAEPTVLTVESSVGLDAPSVSLAADARVKAMRVPVALIDVLLGMPLTESIGSRADATIALVPFGAKEASAVLNVEADGASIDARARIGESSIELIEAAHVRLDSTAFLEGAVKDRPWFSKLAEQIELDEAPGFEAIIERFTASMSADGAIDPASIVAAGEVKLASASGSLALPGGGGRSVRPERLPISLSETVVRVSNDAPDGPVGVTASMTARRDGQDAGALTADLSVVNAMSGDVSIEDVSGSVELEGLIAELAQPVLDAFDVPVRMASDVGPTLDVTVTAEQEDDATDLVFELRGRRASASALARVRGGWFELRDDGLIASIDGAGPLAQRLLEMSDPAMSEDDAAVRFGRIDRASVQARDVRVDLDRLLEMGAMDALRDASGRVAASLTNTDVRVDGQWISGQEMMAQVSRSPGAAPRFALQGAVRTGDTLSPLTASASLEGVGEQTPWDELPGMAWPALVRELKPVAEVRVEGAPITLIERFGLSGRTVGALVEGAEPTPMRRELAVLVTEELVGERVTLNAQFAGGKIDPLAQDPASDWTPTFEGDLSAEAVVLELRGRLGGDEIELREGALYAPLRSGALNPVLATLAGEGEEPIRLGGAATFTAEIDPVSIPLTDRGAVSSARMPSAGVSVSSLNTLTITGLPLPGGDDAGVAVRNIAGVAELPIGAWLGEREGGELIADAAFTLAEGGLSGAGGRVIGEVSLGVQMTDGGASVDVAVTRLDPVALDAQLALGGIAKVLLTGPAEVRVVAESGADDGAYGGVLWVESPGATVDQAAWVFEEDRVGFPEPVTLELRPTRDALTALLGSDVEAPGGVRVQLASAVVATPNETRGPLDGAIRRVEAELRAPQLRMMSSEGVVDTLRDVRVTLLAGPDQKPAAIAINGSATGSNDAPVRITGAVKKLANSRGELTPERAVLSLDVSSPNLPTLLVAHALGDNSQTLVELMGPTLDAEVLARELNKTAGALDLRAGGERAEVTLAGRVADGTFVTTDPVVLSVTEVRPRFLSTMVDVLPLVGEVRKSPSDAPARVTISDLAVGLDGDMSRLNGDIDVDLGTAVFASSDVLGTVLRVARRDAGPRLVGRRVEPFTMSIRKGVVNYPRLTLPIGEFDVQLEGTVDLVNERMDMTTYVPLLALSDEAAGAFNTNLSGLIGRAVPALNDTTLVPIHVRGPFDNPRAQVDPQMFIEGVGRGLFNAPAGLLEGLGDGVLEKLLGGGRRNRDGGG